MKKTPRVDLQTGNIVCYRVGEKKQEIPGTELSKPSVAFATFLNSVRKSTFLRNKKKCVDVFFYKDNVIVKVSKHDDLFTHVFTKKNTFESGKLPLWELCRTDRSQQKAIHGDGSNATQTMRLNIKS